MTIVTINREPSWGDMAVGAIVNLPPALADPLTLSGEAIPTPNATPTQEGPFGSSAATYGATEIDNRAGTSNNIALNIWLAENMAPRGFVLDQISGLEVTGAAATVVSWAATNVGGYINLQSRDAVPNPIAHGLTAASNGRYIYVSSATGIPAGLYRMTYVDATNLTLSDTPFPGGGVTTPVVAEEDAAITVRTVGAPVAAFGAHGVLVGEMTWQASAGATAKFARVLFGGVSAAADVTLNSDVLAHQRIRIENQAVGGLLAASQRCVSEVVKASTVTLAVVDTTIDTAPPTGTVAVTLQIQITAPDEWVRLSSSVWTLYPTL